MGLIADPDVELVLVLAIVAIIFHMLNHRYFKFMEGWRYAIGVLMISLGLSHFITSLWQQSEILIPLTSGLVWVVVGYFVLPSRKKDSKAEVPQATPNTKKPKSPAD